MVLMVLMVLIVLLKLFVIVIAEILTVVDNSSNKRFCSMECMAFEVYCIGVTVQQNIKYKAHFFIYPQKIHTRNYKEKTNVPYLLHASVLTPYTCITCIDSINSAIKFKKTMK